MRLLSAFGTPKLKPVAMPLFPALVVHPPRNGFPVLLSVPHSGRDYDEAVLANCAQGRRTLETLEDPLVDRLAWRAIAAGFGAVIQPVPRAVIDCNRDEEEVDPAAILGISPAPVGPRARHGLGLVPSRTHRHGRLWRQPISRGELNRRIEEVHRPYHDELDRGLNALADVHGEALLIDCHSMPARSHGQAQIVIGDRHGTSSAGWISADAARLARASGFRVELNDPYAGGAIASRHGRPHKGIHAIQLEIDRATYLEPDGRTPGTGFDRLACFIEMLATELGQAMLDRAVAAAAE
jgi:N-formylglutamate amidohydrolase